MLEEEPAMRTRLLRAVTEVGFILFLFYANLLMGEYTRAGLGHRNGLGWAVANIVTPANFTIAVVAALVGYVVVEFLRRKS